MNTAETKVQRLLQIEALLLDHPEGLTQSEIARRLEVNRSTIYRYLPDLTQHAPIFEEGGRLFIDRKAYLVNLKLNLYEALSLHLAARLLTNRIERHNPHTAALLRKLSKTIEKLTPQISKHLSLSANVADDPSRFQDPHYIAVLETLTLAWAEGRVVNIWHRHTETNRIHKYRFSVYFIEPYAVGSAIHVIGLREPPGEVRTFNLARIERVELAKEQYQIPEIFNPTQLLQQAWGIWYTDKEPETVKLRFSSKVVNRVLETRWHPSQQTHVQTDSSLIWSADIAEPKEMISWIRGWGSDCEVISPISLRNKMINEVTALRQIYFQPKNEPHMALWAKFTKGNETDWHSLLWHLLDAAAVTKCLWEECLSASYKNSLANNFNLSLEDMGKLITFWVALHDLGKAGPEFQKKNKTRQKALKSLGFTFPTSRFKVDGFHATATTLILRRILSDCQLNIPRRFRIDLAATLGGHHGEFPDNAILIKSETEKFHVGDDLWQQVQEKIFSLLATFLEIPTIINFPEGNANTNPIFILLVGLTTAADWIASNEEFFPFLNADLPMEEYYSLAIKQAKNALTTLGWFGWKSAGQIASFTDLFPGFTPNQIQQKVIDLCPNLQSPFLAIIEAPTGSGKTEAALYLSDRITQRDQKAGIYIAMPTQATSNQMYTRTANFLAHRYSENKINLHLVHGAAMLSEMNDQFKPTSVWGEDEPDFSNIHAHTWFLPRKKTLLAPFGVGTVDQTFLSVLKSKHFFLRLFGLSHKVLIFDEVHAYDVYMTKIFKTLLHWLHAVGTSVIILSATLPDTTKKELVNAFGAKETNIAQVKFPRITTVTENGTRSYYCGEVPSREIQLKWIDQNPGSIANNLKDQLADGGCAAVICNRINRAQEVFDALNEVYDNVSTEIILFHSRFPYCWRREIENHVISKFGKHTSQRPYRSIVVATQVIEQSLDLDFDIMVTDLAPVDLLIQRIGRLHRHDKSESPPNRPGKLKQPLLILSAPELSTVEKIPDFGADKYIYEPYFLLRTLSTLHERQSVLLPEETDRLIQEVYSLEQIPGMSDSIWDALQNMRSDLLQHQAKSARNADNYLIPSTNISFLGNLKSSFSDDLYSLSKKIISAPTREISPSISIVCLTRESDGIHILNDPYPVDLNAPLSYKQKKSCLKASVTLNHWKVIKYFLHTPNIQQESFKESAILRWHFPVIFKNNKFETQTFSIQLDKQGGLKIRIK